MLWNKILVAYDGSAPSHKALEIASELAEANPSAEFILVHVMLLFSGGQAGTGADAVIMEEAQSIEAELEEISKTLPNKSKIQILKGTSPADLILNCAESEQCDLILMGSRGKGGVSGYLGSVSHRVTKDSPITVIIAKEGKHCL